MKYFKHIEDGYILAISTAYGQTPISKEEYNHILAVIRSKPTPEPGYDYKLKDVDLSWELVELPPEPEPEDVDDAEAIAAIEEALA